jgi:hypothetical protein
MSEHELLSEVPLVLTGDDGDHGRLEAYRAGIRVYSLVDIGLGTLRMGLLVARARMLEMSWVTDSPTSSRPPIFAGESSNRPSRQSSRRISRSLGTPLPVVISTFRILPSAMNTQASSLVRSTSKTPALALELEQRQRHGGSRRTLVALIVALVAFNVALCGRLNICNHR